MAALLEWNTAPPENNCRANPFLVVLFRRGQYDGEDNAETIRLGETFLERLLLNCEPRCGQGRRHAGIRFRGWRPEFSQRRNERESGRNRRRLHDDLLPRTGRRVGDSGISDDAGSVLARMLFGHDQGASTTQMFFVVLLPDGTVCAERGKAVVVNGAKRDDLT
jgi:hypothetical protein